MSLSQNTETMIFSNLDNENSIKKLAIISTLLLSACSPDKTQDIDLDKRKAEFHLIQEKAVSNHNINNNMLHDPQKGWTWDNINLPGVLVAPINIESSHLIKGERIATGKIPYKYDRSFEKGTNIDPSGMKDGISKFLSKLPIQDGVHTHVDFLLSQHYQSMDEGKHITPTSKIFPNRMYISGNTSPEGSWKDWHSYFPNRIDPQNIALGKARAEDAYKLLLDEMSATQGIDLKTLKAVQIQIDSHELQLVYEELGKLAELGGIRSERYSHPLKNDRGEIVSSGEVPNITRGAMELIQTYNRSIDEDKKPQDLGLSDEEVLFMEKAFNSKRHVVIQMKFDNDAKKTDICPIPIPWPLLLLLLRVPRFRLPRISFEKKNTTPKKEKITDIDSDFILIEPIDIEASVSGNTTWKNWWKYREIIELIGINWKIQPRIRMRHEERHLMAQSALNSIKNDTFEDFFSRSPRIAMLLEKIRSTVMKNSNQ